MDMLDIKDLFTIITSLLYIFCIFNDCSLTFPTTIVLVQAAFRVFLLKSANTSRKIYQISEMHAIISLLPLLLTHRIFLYEYTDNSPFCFLGGGPTQTLNCVLYYYVDPIGNYHSRPRLSASSTPPAGR